MTPANWNDRSPIADIDLLLTESLRVISSMPHEVSIGGIGFQGWQLYKIELVSDNFDGYSPYLIQVNYDTVFRPAEPTPRWLEVGFAFETPTVMVTDVIPRRIVEPTGPTSYALTPHLTFGTADVPSSIHADVQLPFASIAVPAYHPVVEASGVGGPNIRWRHTPRPGEQLTSGSHTAWFVLLVPLDCQTLQVETTADFDLAASELLDLEPASDASGFHVELPMRPTPNRRRSPHSTAQVEVPQQEDDAWSDMRTRMGFTVDIVGFTERQEVERKDAQDRLDQLVRHAVHKIGVDFDSTLDQPTGDGMNVFLPDLDVAKALPALLHAMTSELKLDNRRYRDRIRLRMAVDIGPVGRARLGFSGPTILSSYRLVESEPLRNYLSSESSSELGVLLSSRMYYDYVQPGYPDLDAKQFRPVTLQVKGFQAEGWLWTPTM